MNLFENFERAVRDAIAGEIRRGRLGRLTAQMQSRTRYSRGVIRRLAGAAQSRIDRFTSQTYREARTAVWRALRSALKPLANLLRGLSGSWNRSGGGGLPPAPPGIPPAGDAPEPARSSLDEAIRNAVGLLESQGYTVSEPGASPESFGFRPAAESGGVQFKPWSESPRTNDVVVGGRRRAADPNDPVFTGEMIPVESSNVHSIGFIWNTDDPMKGTLKVRFLQSAKGDRSSKGAGPLYHYHDVHPDVFDAFVRANSKGGFVWDRLRIRGTVSGHRFHYDLKGITNGYVPRKATRLGKNEYFIGRSAKFRNAQGQTREFSSSLPDQFVQNLGGGPGNRRKGPGGFVPAEPNRGRPNRGRP